MCAHLYQDVCVLESDAVGLNNIQRLKDTK